ncbi:uncharacterized protein LOC141904322 [Tubulanus polymorphus]|uniref:uncharacterized protein LOC141904322 n=1 Tax=Tubulanus polymorphus TaxID=672921 RepID=UPI003DA5E044
MDDRDTEFDFEAWCISNGITENTKEILLHEDLARKDCLKMLEPDIVKELKLSIGQRLALMNGVAKLQCYNRNSPQTQFPNSSQSSSSFTSNQSFTVSEFDDSADEMEVFKIPYDKIDSSTLELLRSNTKPNSAGMKELIRNITAQIVYQKIPTAKSSIERVARKLTSKFPCLKETDLSGRPIGNGIQSLVSSIQWRLINQRRLCTKPTVYTSKKRVGGGDLEGTSCVSSSNRDSYGCINWSVRHAEGETPVSQVMKQEFLKSEFIKGVYNAEIDEAMRLTYSSQRHMINSHEPLSEIRNAWPYLMTYKYLMAHFDTLMHLSIHDLFDEAIMANNKAGRLYNFIMRKSKNAKCSSWVAEMDKHIAQKRNKEALTIGFLPLLERNAIRNLGNSAIIIALGENIFESTEFLIAVESRILIECLSTWQQAVEAWFSVHYVFNLAYDDNCKTTLEFIQRCVMNINPDKGSKSLKKRKYSVDPRIIRLVNDLKEMDSDWGI